MKEMQKQARQVREERKAQVNYNIPYITYYSSLFLLYEVKLMDKCEQKLSKICITGFLIMTTKHNFLQEQQLQVIK